MKMTKQHFLAACLLFCLPVFAGAQESEQSKGIPADVFYLMPNFGEGTVYFRGKAPAQGQMNICAVDNTLRYLDQNGTEMSAADIDNIIRVQIDTVLFFPYRDVFYRMYPVTSDVGVALKRDVKILRDVKRGAYGMESQTSSIQEVSTLYTEGGQYTLSSSRNYPYRASEEIYLYKGDNVYPLSRKNLKKLFPEKQERIEAWFKAVNSLPKTADAVQALLKSWME